MSTAKAANDDLERQIEELKKCKPLPEDEVRELCSKAQLIL